MLKKLARTLDEMAKNEELMAGIFGEAEMDPSAQPTGEKRLVTIGEDGELDSKRLGGTTQNGNEEGDNYEEDDFNNEDDDDE